MTTPRQRMLSIIDQVAFWHEVETSDIMSRSRLGHFVKARRDAIVAIALLYPEMSYPRLGKLFGLDHSTCIHHVHAAGYADHRAAHSVPPPADEWRKIPSLPNHSASNDGRIRNDKTGTIRKPFVSPKEYSYLGFGPKNNKVCRTVHTLVAEAFYGPRPNGLECRHLDGKPSNNWVTNLRYGTKVENAADREAHGNTQRGVKNGKGKIKDASIPDAIRAMYAEGGITQYELADIFEISQAQVNNIILGRQWRKPTPQPAPMQAAE